MIHDLVVVVVGGGITMIAKAIVATQIHKMNPPFRTAYGY